MFKVIRTIILDKFNCLKQLFNSEKKTPTDDVTIVIHSGDNSIVSVTINKQ